MAHEFDGRLVVVTGGTGGLGRGVVAALVERGAACLVPCFDPSELRGFSPAEAERVRVVEGVDLTDEESVRSFYAGAEGLWASVHLAGGFSMAPIEETSLEAFDRLVDLNLRTCFLSCRDAARAMRAAGRGGGGGRIVNVAARPALAPTGGLAAYAATKAGVVGLTLSLSEELREAGIWVNAIAPSIIDTPANRAAMPGADHASWPSPGEIAQTICFLASPGNETTRGAVVPVCGAS